MNTTAYHTECDGMIERFNRTLKTMLCKRATRYGVQWNNHLPTLLWSYRNTPHNSTGEKTLYILIGCDCRSPTDAAFLHVEKVLQYTTMTNYHHELIETLSSAREMAIESIQEAQCRYKFQYNKSVTCMYLPGDCVLILFPSEESGRLHKHFCLGTVHTVSLLRLRPMSMQ